MKNRPVIAFASFALTLFASRVLAQDGTNAATQVAPLSFQGKIFAPFWDQVVNNPASMASFVFLCIVAYLMDDTPIINSRFVSHITTFLGCTTYWIFAGVESVPHYFPHPLAVLGLNGMITGLAAGLFHRNAIAIAVNFFRSRTGAVDEVPSSRRFLREPTASDKIFCIGQQAQSDAK